MSFPISNDSKVQDFSSISPPPPPAHCRLLRETSPVFEGSLSATRSASSPPHPGAEAAETALWHLVHLKSA
ncbi:hypothetical protein CesoFtcFv8_024957 [Champsocephalus esox]|uniref:Uncharacterized protein n=2 Tax=Champsocephalus TaxID=52236 RepID=A0AAN8C7N7_CHAGU|nr:hypothetical protein CesoFtcFv8_024957 [Champsocephalus esox]KAK5898415.1 hypothetical protein CgunFtcFv8_015836 [Champsocephalus gunnari]